MSIHEHQDVLLYIPFLLGQFLYILKRAGFSVRAGRAPSRRAYLYQNWDILLFRAGLAVFIYGIVRHFSIGNLLSTFHVGNVSSLTFLYKPVDSALALFGFGIGADGLVDWAVDWASRKDNTKVPDAIKNWLSENVQTPEDK